MSALEASRAITRRRHVALELLGLRVEHLLQPQDLAVASQWVRAQPEMSQRREDSFDRAFEGRQLVAVQPEVSQRRVRRTQNVGADSIESTVVQVESGRLQSFEGLRYEAEMTVTVEEEMLKNETAKYKWTDGANLVVAEVQPLEIDEVSERVHFHVYYSALAHVQVAQLAKAREVRSSQRSRLEDVRVQVQLETVDGYSVWNGLKTSPRTVDDLAE